ncbi:TRAP transporter small permease [Propionivibrio sp.]|jgi:TRAP-type C4-dicarboxylate transport system permease small subunit|uniref:TRAP transporter small permease n=1 Tax=Propionivibrio sp. TaxID=2212460 RepID=UPI0039E2F9E5
MGVFCKTFSRIDDAVAKVEDIFVLSLHGLIALLVMLSVFLRYVFNAPLTWGEELIVALLTWMVFVGAAAAVRSQMHIRIDVMAPVFRMAKFNWLNTVTVLVGSVILAAAVYSCIDQVLQEAIVESPMMGVSRAWFVSAMPVGLALMLMHVLRAWMEFGAAPVFRDETEVLVMKEEGLQ